MSPDKLDQKINKLAAELERLRRRKRPRTPKPRSTRPPGRPRVAEEKIAAARELVRRGYAIEDVAFRLDVDRTTLNRYGITRSRLDREKRAAAAAHR
jgi:transposase-like protein